MPGKQPTLPAKKPAAGSKKAAGSTAGKDLPSFIELEGGEKIPIKIPPGMPAEQAAAVVEYLRANPAAAKAAYEQAQAVMANPGMANALMRGQPVPSQAMGTEVFEALKDDPELAEVFEDVKANGAAALQKYWDDTDLMSKISAKLRALQLSKRQQQAGGDGAAGAQQAGADGAQQQQGGEGGGVPSKHGPAPAARKVETLHDAARWGDVEAAKRMLAEGADVNGKNDRGIPVLGVAVGFNQKEVVRLLLDSGADVAAADSKGSTALHYAAGYGRCEVAAMLVEAGADVSASNDAKQKPADVAKLNGEKKMVEWLKEQAAARKA